MQKVAFHNLGCKVNAYEMDVMEQKLQNRGYEIVDFAQKADIYVINTCSVTNIADRKSRQMIHRAKALNPDSIVVAVGCFIMADPKKAALDPDIDLMIGNNRKADLIDLIEEFCEIKRSGGLPDKTLGGKTVPDLTDHPKYESMSIDKTSEHTRAYIKIQDGCDQFCSYCIIPYVRGRIRSREHDDIIREVKTLSSEGYKEVVLTGIHLSSYGITGGSYNQLAEEGFTNTALLDLIDDIAQIDGIDRIRLGSLEPRLITDEFLRRIAAEKKICPHFHISLQSGCDSVLKRMNRHYSAAEYMQRVEMIRSYFEHPAITTDVIAGFPMETDEEHAATRDYLARINFYEVHVFKYSRRAGTVADRMKGQLTDKQKQARSSELIADDAVRRHDFTAWYIGKPVEVLLEEEIEIDGHMFMSGYTPEYVRCAVEADSSLRGNIVHAIGEGVANECLMCTIPCLFG